MSCRAVAAIALALAVGFVPVLAIAAAPAESSARRLAAEIEHRAAATSFAELRRFGEAAGQAKGLVFEAALASVAMHLCVV